MPLLNGLPRLLQVLFLASLAAACPAPRERPGIPARHLLLVTVAGLRAGHTSAWQYQRPTTWSEIDGGLRRDGRALAIDDLAAEGIMFARTFAPSGSTPAALASLMSGRSALETGVVEDGDALPRDGSTLARAMAAGGFETAAFVSSELLAGESWRDGFEAFEVASDDRSTLGAALDWVNQHDYGNGQGVFLWIHLSGPTFPFEPTLEQGTFDRGGAVDFSQLFTDPYYSGPADGSAAFRRSAGQLTPEDREHIVDLYDGEVAQANHLLQLFLDFYLYAGAPSEVWERSLFVLAGSGGLELFEGEGTSRNWGETQRLTDSVLHVPLLLRHPDSLTGRRIFGQITELQDLTPTLLDWFGLPPAAQARGRSLLAISDEAGRGFVSRPAFACRARAGRIEALSVRDDRYRLIWTPDSEHPFELVDQSVDPLALDDLSAELPRVVERLRGELEAWIATADPDLDLSAFVGGP